MEKARPADYNDVEEEVPMVIRSVLLLCTVGVAASCGGGGGGGGSLHAFAFPSNAFNDGYVSTQPAVLRDSVSVVLGWDDLNEFVVRGFYRFLHTGIPAGAKIVSATLLTYQFDVFGDPYSALGGGVLVDHLDMGEKLYVEDFDSAALSSAIGVLSADATLGVKTLNVKSEVQADVDALRPYTDFRLRFPLDSSSDRQSHFASFSDAEDAEATGFPPVLLVTWHD